MNHSAYHYPSPHAAMTGPALGQSRWTSGFWADRFELCHRTILPSMRRALQDPTNKARLAYFRIAAGLEEGAHEGTNWSDGDCYKWLEAMAHVYGATRDAELDVQMDEAIGWIAAAQEPDGYLNTQITLDPAKQRWQNVHDHELYNVGHCFTAAAVHFEATGKRTFLEVAVKLADNLCGVFLPTPRALANFGFNPSQIVGLVDLYRVTGDRRYLELAGVFVTNRGSAPDPGVNGDQNQDRVRLREETAAVGHAVTATYLWAGAADVYAETGEAALREALQRIWADVVSNKLYLTGAVGAHHFSASIRRDPVHEAFGLPHELRNATAYTETCANIGQGMWAWRMAALTGDARYGDVLEQVLYNSGLSGMSADGTRFCYTNPLRWHGAEHRRLSHDTPERWFTHSCYCCPPQVARTIARLHRWAYGLADDAVWVHLYGGSRLQTEVAGGALVLTQETDYPWDGTIVITLREAPAEPFTLHLRVPGWAQGAELEVAGAPVAAAPGTYVAVRRHWQAGDRVTLTLPLHAELVTAHPRLEQDRNQAAVVRGPVVYCLEAVDLSAGVPLDEIHLPRDFAPAAHYEPDLLGGIAVLEGTAIRAKARPWATRTLPPRRCRRPRSSADPHDPLFRLAQPRQPRHGSLAPAGVATAATESLQEGSSYQTRAMRWFLIWCSITRDETPNSVANSSISSLSSTRRDSTALPDRGPMSVSLRPDHKDPSPTRRRLCKTEPPRHLRSESPSTRLVTVSR